MDHTLHLTPMSSLFLVTSYMSPDVASSYMSPDVASGKEMSDSFEGTSGSGKQEGKPSKKHKKSTRARSRQEKSNRPKLTILNVSNYPMFK